MATIKIGDLSLDVPLMTMGVDRRVLRPARVAFFAALAEADAGPRGDEWADAVTKAVSSYLLAFIPTADLEQLADNLPPPARQFGLLKTVRELAGFADAPPGEVASP